MPTLVEDHEGRTLAFIVAIHGRTTHDLIANLKLIVVVYPRPLDIAYSNRVLSMGELLPEPFARRG